MCGITGYFSKSNQISENQINKMCSLISHRGPDDQGSYTTEYADFQIGLGHVRLSILDLSSAGHQPMFFENLAITFNGEIYNFQCIQKELIEKGYTFHSHSDTEVLIKAFHCWGENCVTKFNGMFSFAIYDKNTGKLYLFRDRLGIKPLYVWKNRESLVFGSELKPIIHFPGFTRKLNLHSVDMMLFHGYITGPDCIFQDVFKLLPGNYLIFDGHKMEIKEYWSVEDRFLNRSNRNETPLLDFENEFEDLLTDSVRLRLLSDVPVGTFLSGGYDSSLVTAIAQKVTNKPVKTFSIGFHEQEYNEANHAKLVSQHLETDHTEFYVSIKETLNLIPEIAQYYDEPFADSSQIPTMMVSEIARKDIKVVLSGDGGDELFCGYGRYENVLRFRDWKRTLAKTLTSLNTFLPIEKLLWKYKRTYAKLMHINTDANLINFDYLHSKNYLQKLIPGRKFKIHPKYFSLLEHTQNIQEAYMLHDMITYLPDDILTKVDRASMRVALECRVPLLDHRIVEFSHSLPHQWKYQPNNLKYFLKRVVHKHIPESIMNRPKMGFGIPVYHWLKTNLKEHLNHYMGKEFILKQNVFNYHQVKWMADELDRTKDITEIHRYIWHFLMFQMWYEKYFEV